MIRLSLMAIPILMTSALLRVDVSTTVFKEDPRNEGEAEQNHMVLTFNDLVTSDTKKHLHIHCDSEARQQGSQPRHICESAYTAILLLMSDSIVLLI